MSHSQRATIYDVARAANVAPSTVSRAFSQPSRVNEHTVHMIKAKAAKLGYSTNRTARGLSTGRTRNLAMVVPNIGNPFFSQFMRAFHSTAHERGYSVYLIDTDEDADEEIDRVSAVSSQVDGIALVSPRMAPAQLLEVTATGRFVVVHRKMNELACVWIDSRPALRELFADLAGSHHHTVIYVRGPQSGYSDSIRRRAARRFAAETGIQLVFTPPQHNEKSGAVRALDLVDLHNATAVVAHSDAAAVAVLSECRTRGVDVPGQVSVIGHDDIEWASAVYPALTTISARTDDTGRWSAEMLIDLIEEPEDEAPRRLPERSAVAQYIRRASFAPTRGK